LEHAFVDYPKIISLFNEGRVEGTIDLPVDGVLHSFEPTVTVIMDQESGEEIGKRVQLHDVSTDLEESTTPNIARDSVTNLYNQESFYLIGEKLLDHAKRTNTKMAMVVVGIDELDRLVEKYSSGVVDGLLKILVGVIAPLLQDADLIARMENNTLALLLLFPPESNSTALEVCFRIKRKIGDMFFDYDLFRIQLSVSQGYTVYDGSIQADLQSMYSTARKALVNLQLEGVNGIDFMQLEQVQA
jgi:diguanylate cyclase (GGDEF)-like protein